ncbi:MAG: asparagine synthase (glutamine-hydrolyzing) [Ferruginibacter sp.]|nr:asparagine synthase (glutamine-hydrolyzing) [Ferruginibacter sp.]
MCGIAGIISLNNLLVSKGRITKMTDSIAYRGPDGEGYWINNEGTVGFGHRRLAIIDLTKAAAQPMQLQPGVSPSCDGKEERYTITYNGEIYNYIEVKEALSKKGYRFQTQSDTEIILAAYDYWKEECLYHFDGMFSFAIWDNREKTLFAARDRFGEKPFYYYEDKEQFVFGSEMKALWAAGVEKKTDEKMLLNYITLGHVQNANDKEQTFFVNIYALPPAHYLQINFSNFRARIHTYWDIDKENTVKITANGAMEKFADLFKKSVTRRLRSDVSIGTSLSGGLDSSAIAATIHQLQKGHPKLQSFSAVFPGFEKDESAYIQTVVKKFRLQNFQTIPTAEGLIKDFQTLCYHQEEPFGSSSIYAQFKVFELAKQHQVKVLLDGQGADETQAGYNNYIHWYLQQLLSRNKIRTFQHEKKLFQKKKIPFKWGAKNYLAAFFPSHASIQLERIEYNNAIRHPAINPDFVRSLRGREWEGIHKPIITKLNDILYFNTYTMGLEELLRFADRNSMAHGREVRLPFLNHELVEFIFSLPAHFKIHDGCTKWLLRSSMNKKLPNEIVWRNDKVGYEPPQHQWMQNETLKDFIHESKRKLVNNRILKKTVLDKKVLPLTAYQKDNFDWRYLCAAQII